MTRQELYQLTDAELLLLIAEQRNGGEPRTEYDETNLSNALKAISLHLRGAILDSDEYHSIAWAAFGEEKANEMFEIN